MHNYSIYSLHCQTDLKACIGLLNRFSNHRNAMGRKAENIIRVCEYLQRKALSNIEDIQFEMVGHPQGSCLADLSGQ